MRKHFDAEPAPRSSGGISAPRKKKEKKSSGGQNEADKYTGFMHSLMGEEATQDNRQRVAMNVSDIVDTRKNPAFFLDPEVHLGNNHFNSEHYENEGQYYPYSNQNTIERMNIPPAQSCGTVPDSEGSANNNTGYDYTKSFQMMPMQRFMESSVQDTYKYDSNAHHQLTEDAMRLQKPTYGVQRGINSNNRIMGTDSYGLDEGQVEIDRKDGDRECDGESECHSAIGEDEGPGKRKTRNEREQKRSLKISEQIDMLGQLLSSNGIDVKINKYNILSKVSDYIKDLQQKNAERARASGVSIPSKDEQQLVAVKGKKESSSKSKIKSSQHADPISSSSMSLTNWPVDEVTRKANSGKKENSDESASTADDRKKSKKNEIAPILSEEEYFSAFQWCSVPWALARVDGRFCDCNEAFSRASGFSRNEVLSFTIFNLINPVDLQDTFSAVGSLLTNYHYGGSGSRFDPAAPASASTYESATATTIRRRAKLSPSKEIEKQIVKNEYDPTSSTSHQHHTTYEPHPALKKKLRSLRAINLPPTPSLDLVVSLVRAEVDKRPSYFHVRLIPSRTDCMTVHPPADDHQYIDSMEASRPGPTPGPGYNPHPLSQESNDRYRLHLSATGGMEDPSISNRPGAGLGSGSGSGPGSGVKQAIRAGTGVASWSGVVEDIGGGKRSHDSPREDDESNRHLHDRVYNRRAMGIEHRSEVVHTDLDVQLHHLQDRQHRQQQQQQHHNQQQQQQEIQRQQHEQQQSSAHPAKQYKKSFLKSSGLSNKTEVTGIEDDGPNNYPTKGPGLPPSYEFNPSMNLWTSSQYTSGPHRTIEPPCLQSAASSSLRGHSWVNSDDACIPLSVSSYSVTSSEPNRDREKDGTALENTHGRLGWPSSYPPEPPLEQMKNKKPYKLSKATKNITSDIIDSNNNSISGTGTGTSSSSGSGIGGKKTKKLPHPIETHAVIVEASPGAFRDPKEDSPGPNNSASVRVMSEEKGQYARTGGPKFSPYRDMREGRDKNDYYAEGEGDVGGVGLGGVMLIDEELNDQRGRERRMEGESAEIAHDGSVGSEDRSTGTMREESQSQPDSSGYNYDNFFDDLMEVATSADIEGYFDPKTV